YGVSSSLQSFRTLTGRIPLVGTLRVGGGDFQVTFPAMPSIEIDLDRVRAPPVTTERLTTETQWNIVDGDPRPAHALVQEYSWMQPIANYEVTVDLHIY